MPKILKNNTTGSGNTSLSGRIKIRERDNLPGSYPTIHRSGDTDRTGKLSLNPFDDQKTIIFGRKIEDDFLTSGVDNTTSFDSKKWSNSTGLRIRNEIISGIKNEKLLGRSVVFEGADTVRFLQTVDKIRNPEVRFELQVGPYNLEKNGLNLQKGKASDVLLVQISTNGTNWTTIKTYTPPSNIKDFYGEQRVKKNIFKKFISLSTVDIVDPGESYYLRFAQTSMSNFNVATWAISKIEIEYANQSNITYGLNLNLDDTACNNVKEKYMSTPHIIPNLKGIGIQRKGLSDSMLLYNRSEESMTAFNEKIQVLDLNRRFFNEGTSPDIYPGFEISAKNKTSFNISLDTSEATSVGYTNNFTDPADDEEDVRNKIMVFWNNDLSRWEKIGDGVRWGHSDPGRSIETLDSWLASSSNVALGFGPQVAKVASASDTDASSLKNLLDEDYISATSRPVDNFSFPFGSTYNATSSYVIKAKDIGITKPFLLEKCSLNFNANFESIDGDAANRFNSLNLAINYRQLVGTPSTTTNLPFRLITPTFFILRQYKSKASTHARNHEWNYIKASAGPSYSKEVDSVTNENSINANNLTRELITYGQLTIITTGSAAAPSKVSVSNWLSQDNINKLLDSGMKRDELVIDSTHASGMPKNITGNFQVNFPSRVTPAYDDSVPMFVALGDPNGRMHASYKFGKKIIGRSTKITTTTRAIVNGVSPKRPGNEELIPFTSMFFEPIKTQFPDKTSIDLISPYLILPDDDLIFGWQYPLLQNIYPTSLNRNFMTLSGASNLKLIGSLIVDNKEFHETTNQNITSPCLYEHIIGNEKVVDAFQINTNHEHSGSFLDLHTRTNTINRTARVGLKQFSVTSGDAGTTGSFGRYLRLVDQNRVYEDSKKRQGTFFNNSFYGTLNSTQVYDSAVGSAFGSSQKLSPRYYYNYKHFGYFSDMLRQSIDSKYASVTKTLSSDEIISSVSPINIVFVQGEVVNTPEARVYKRKEVDELLDDSNFQSSNLSTFATASIPFIDDNQARNRTYVEGAFIAV